MSLILLDPLIQYYSIILGIKPKTTTAISKIIILYELSRIYELRLKEINSYKFVAPEITLHMRPRDRNNAIYEGYHRYFKSSVDRKPYGRLMGDV